MLHPHLPVLKWQIDPGPLSSVCLGCLQHTPPKFVTKLQGQPSARPVLPTSCGAVEMGGRAKSFRTKPLCLPRMNAGSAAEVDAWEEAALWERCSLPHHRKIYCLGGKCFAGGWETVLSLKFRMTFVVAFHTTDQEAPGNNDRATLSAVPGSPQQAAWMLTEVLQWQQAVGTQLKGHSRAWSLGNYREVWQGAALQKIDIRAVQRFCSAWEGR